MTTTNTLIGVALAGSGNIIQSFAFVAQKVGHNRINEQNKKTTDKESQKSILTDWMWWLGMIAYTIGGTMNSISLNFAALAITAPLSAIKLGSMAILSYFILKEPLSKKDIFAIITIIIGIILVVSFGPSSQADITISDLRQYFQGIPYIITVIILIIITVSDYIIVKFVERKNFKDINNEEITYGKNVLLFSYIWIGVFFATNNVLFIKASVAIIISSITSSKDAKQNWTDFVTYFIILCTATCMVSMEYWRQKALSHFGVLYVVPIFNVLGIILVSLVGMIFFDEFGQFTVLSALMFTLGIIITVIGVFVLSFDVAKIWTELYDNYIKVALIEYGSAEYKYPQQMCVDGPTAEYFQRYFLKKRAVFVNMDISKGSVQNENESNDRTNNSEL
eukprot:350251_1